MLYCHFGITSSEGFLCLFIGLVCFLLLFNYKNSACLLKQFQQKRMGHTCVYRYMYGIHVSHRHVCTQWLCSLFFKNNHCPLLELCSIDNFDMKEKIGINLRFIPLSNILSISQALPLPLSLWLLRLSRPPSSLITLLWAPLCFFPGPLVYSC